MKRFGDLYDKIVSVENLTLAEKKARKGKSHKYDVRKFDENSQDNLINLHHILLNGDYNTSKYKVFKLFDGKEREIFKLPYYPDRIVHHAILNVLEPIFVSNFTSDTYSCIKGRGIHKALNNVTTALKQESETMHCLKLDIQKFYPNVNHEVLKVLLRRKFKDTRLLVLLDEIIDSADGLPIGNYLSQFLANFYLSGFDHWLKEELRIKFYFRYCDDLVILAKTKEELHELLKKIRTYLYDNLKLKLKENYQVFPIKSRGLNFVGYKSYHTHILIRPSIKDRFIKMVKYNDNIESRASYNGWLTHANCINLKNKYKNEESKNQEIRV